MNKKILIQFFLFSLFIILSIFFYYKYFKKDSQILKISKTEKIASTIKDNIQKQFVDDVINMITQQNSNLNEDKIKSIRDKLNEQQSVDDMINTIAKENLNLSQGTIDNIKNSGKKAKEKQEKIKATAQALGQPSETNLIKGLRYFSVDDNGNEYEIKSEYGKMTIENPDIILMTNVMAKINIYNSEPIIITSEFAKYNVKNYDTNFEKNILVRYVDNKLNGENLDLSFQNNLMSIYNNIIYQNLNTKLLADKLEIDLVTKDSKITMNDKKGKIKIIKKKIKWQ